MGDVQIECTKTDLYWMHCQLCHIDGPRTEDLEEAERQRVEHHLAHQSGTAVASPLPVKEVPWEETHTSELPVNDAPGTIQFDDRGFQVLVHVVPPTEWLTLDQLRQWAAFLAKQADEGERPPEVEELTSILETAALGNSSPRAMARILHGSGYRLARVTA